MKWAPVSPPVVVVLDNSRLRWSWDKVTTTTPTTATALAAAGSQRDSPRRRGRHGRRPVDPVEGRARGAA